MSVLPMMFNFSSGLATVGTLLDRIFWAVEGSAPYGETQQDFIHFWDKNVREVVELLLPTGRSMCSSSGYAATVSCRPDCPFLINNLCPFRGGEESPESTANLEQENLHGRMIPHLMFSVRW